MEKKTSHKSRDSNVQRKLEKEDSQVWKDNKVVYMN